jgi:hypothetical protein
MLARARGRGLLFSSLRRTYRFGEPQAGVVVGFGAITTPDVPRAITALNGCLR